jgi:hypothetical protein
MHTHLYEYTHTSSTPRSIFEDCAGNSSRLTKSPQTSRCRREHRSPLKAQTSLNHKKFAPPRGVEPRLEVLPGLLYPLIYRPFRGSTLLPKILIWARVNVNYIQHKTIRTRHAHTWCQLLKGNTSSVLEKLTFRTRFGSNIENINHQ